MSHGGPFAMINSAPSVHCLGVTQALVLVAFEDHSLSMQVDKELFCGQWG